MVDQRVGLRGHCRFMSYRLFFYVLFGVLLAKIPLVWAHESVQYKLAPGDVVHISVLGEKDLSFDELRLSDVGSFSYPFLGELNVQGKEVAEIEQLIADALRGDYLIDPKVSVSVLRYRQFFIAGEVRNPGGYPYQPGLTLRRAVALAGGMTERATESRITIVRDQGSTKWTQKGSLDSPLMPGDTITIAPSFF